MHLVDYITKKFVMMHGHMNIKYSILESYAYNTPPTYAVMFK